MDTKYYLSLIIFFFLLYKPDYASAQDDKSLIISTINQLFEGMRQGDSTIVGEVLSPELRLLTVTESKGKVVLKEVSRERFLDAVGAPHDAVWDEKIGSYEVRMDDRLASVWTTYKFYLGNDFSHCGVNSFQLYKTHKGWQIFAIADTRRLDNCP